MEVFKGKGDLNVLGYVREEILKGSVKPEEINDVTRWVKRK